MALWSILWKITLICFNKTVLSLGLSIYLFFFMDHYDGKLYGIYVGLWVPSILGAFRVIETGRVEKEDGTD